MVRFINSHEREEEVLGLVVENYIRESKPISSTYLCAQCHLPYSSATIRNVMEALEKKGLLDHLHISSGRVPTQEGFKYYVHQLMDDSFTSEDIDDDYSSRLELAPATFSHHQELIDYTLDALARISGYTSLVAISGGDERMFFRGARFILEQPEFEDIQRLKDLFYLLEVRLDDLHEALFNFVDDRIKILIGDEIGVAEAANCSLIVSGAKEVQLPFTLALLGPMRMDYAKAVSCLGVMKKHLSKVVSESR